MNFLSLFFSREVVNLQCVECDNLLVFVAQRWCPDGVKERIRGEVRVREHGKLTDQAEAGTGLG